MTVIQCFGNSNKKEPGTQVYQINTGNRGAGSPFPSGNTVATASAGGRRSPRWLSPEAKREARFGPMDASPQTERAAGGLGAAAAQVLSRWRSRFGSGVGACRRGHGNVTRLTTGIRSWTSVQLTALRPEDHSAERWSPRSVLRRDYCQAVQVTACYWAIKNGREAAVATSGLREGAECTKVQTAVKLHLDTRRVLVSTEARPLQQRAGGDLLLGVRTGGRDLRWRGSGQARHCGLAVPTTRTRPTSPCGLGVHLPGFHQQVGECPSLA